jgi:hypothetical protein
MRKRQYDNWKLYDIGLWHGGSRIDEDLMALMAKCVPSVRSFWGDGIVDG